MNKLTLNLVALGLVMFAISLVQAAPSEEAENLVANMDSKDPTKTSKRSEKK